MRMLPGEEPPNIETIRHPIPDGQGVPVPGFPCWAELDARARARTTQRRRPWRHRLPWLALLLGVIAFGLWACGAIG